MDSALVGYHPTADQLGPLDSPPTVLGSRGQVPNAADNTVVAPWNRLEVLERIMQRHADRIAAVMMEPVLCNSGCLLPAPGYLEGVAGLCRRHQALLIFDEVITGFRLGLAGAQGHYGITPDLATFGQGGGGRSRAQRGGRTPRDHGADVRRGRVRRHLQRQPHFAGGGGRGAPRSCPAPTASRWRGRNRIGRGIMDGIAALARKHGLNVAVRGFGAAFALHFNNPTGLLDYRDTLADDRDLLRRFLALALRRGAAHRT